MVSLDSIITGQYNWYARSVQPLDLGQSKLTADELALAKEYEAYLEFNDNINRLMRGEGTEETEAYIRDRKENYELYKDQFKNVQRAMGIIISDTEDIKLVDITNLPAFNLPNGGFQCNKAENSMTIGIGSLITIGGRVLSIMHNYIGIYDKDKKPADDYGSGIAIRAQGAPGLTDELAAALRELLYAVGSGNANFGDNLPLNSQILTLLRELGIDTTRNFTINDTQFEINNGIVQTKDYTPPEESPSGYEYLNAILLKAYEQNMMYNDKQIANYNDTM